jgi:fido (protein-threonine AMPylation protein)
MATPKEKLAASLEVLYTFQEKGQIALRSEEISRTHRERLSLNGFLSEITRGWYILTDPNATRGDSAAWLAMYWRFCAQYFNYKFQNDYFISADQSLLIHSGNTTIPSQLVIKSPKASNTKIDLMHQCSFFEMKSKMPISDNILKDHGLNVYSLASSLVYCSPSIFKKYPNDVSIVMSQFNDASEILTILLKNSHTIIAGRLAGAFRFLKKDKIAKEIISAMRAAGHKLWESNPFEQDIQLPKLRSSSPYAQRIEVLWDKFRPMIIDHFPKSPGLNKDIKSYLDSIDKIYESDAYHSLSIENYSVTKELIEKVRSGNWNIDKDPSTQQQVNAMAARGYWLASRSVKESIQKILQGNSPGEVLKNDHGLWYKELFSPSVQAGIISPSALAGYRMGQVYISRSRHVPMNKEAVREALPVYFDLLKQEEHAGVRAILGHFVFVYIHPYMDGNGRMARFLMNTMLASGGYPWTVIPVEERDKYMNALEEASVNENILPFVEFISKLVNK